MADKVELWGRYGILRVQPPPHDPAPKQLDAQAVIADFYRRICERAETNMAQTGTVSGAHWNAMQQVMAEMGIEVAK